MKSQEKDIEEGDEERHTDDAKPAKSAEKAPSQLPEHFQSTSFGARLKCLHMDHL